MIRIICTVFSFFLLSDCAKAGGIPIGTETGTEVRLLIPADISLKELKKTDNGYEFKPKFRIQITHSGKKELGISVLFREKEYPVLCNPIYLDVSRPYGVRIRKIFTSSFYTTHEDEFVKLPRGISIYHPLNSYVILLPGTGDYIISATIILIETERPERYELTTEPVKLTVRP